MKRVLVTTAIEETWPSDKPVLFLGEWCRLYSRRAVSQAMDAVVCPYHWDDREKLLQDFQALQGLYEVLLVEVTAGLNSLHGETFSLRYWRILVGAWLGYFTQIVFDRWAMLLNACRQYEIVETIVLRGAEETLVPNDTGAFARMYVGDDWNHHIYTSIIERCTKITCASRARSTTDNITAFAPPPRKGSVYRSMATAWMRLGAKLRCEDDAFFITTYLPPAQEAGLQLRLGQLPQFWTPIPTPAVGWNPNFRQWKLRPDLAGGFGRLVRDLIPQQMPRVFLEGYAALRNEVRSAPWPKRPKLIFTSNSHLGDDFFKAWAAEKVEAGRPLIIGQHGGHYGIGRWSFVESHEIAISDRFLTWGWSQAGSPKVTPVGQLKALKASRVRHATAPRLLLVTCALPRYSYCMYSVIVAGQYIDYFKDQCAFVSQLPATLRQALTVRLFPSDWGWGQRARWNDQFPDVELDAGDKSLNDRAREARIYVSTYNATTYLESFAMNIPTIIFWNPKHWEIRDTARPHFDALKCAGVFHESPQSAAHFIATIWEHVDDWWQSPAVRKAVGQFQVNFSRRPRNFANVFKRLCRGEQIHPD